MGMEGCFDKRTSGYSFVHLFLVFYATYLFGKYSRDGDGENIPNSGLVYMH